MKRPTTARTVSAVAASFATVFAVACGSTPPSEQRTVSLSDFFVVKQASSGLGVYRTTRNDIFVGQPDGELEYVGSTTASGPSPGMEWQFGEGAVRGLAAIGLAISEDGRSIVFRHAPGEARGRSDLETGIYQYVHGEGLKLLVGDEELGGTFWVRWGKEFPSSMIPFRYQGPQPPADVTWALTASGEKLPLALVGASPLHWAAFEGRTTDCVDRIDAGADIDTLTYWDFTPLDLAIIADHQETAIRLLKEGADPDAGRYPAFHRAVMLGRLEVVRTMLEGGGVDVNEGDDENGYTPYHLAVFAGARLVGGMTEFFPTTQLSVMERNVTDELIQLVLDHGADPSIPDRYGRTHERRASSG